MRVDSALNLVELDEQLGIFMLSLRGKSSVKVTYKALAEKNPASAQ